MTADVELLPCPFCGGEAEAETYIVEAKVACLSCRAKIVRQHGARDDNGLPEAIAAWNSRATAANDAEIEALRAEIGRWRALADTGTAESFLALSDDDKRKWFVMALRESSERKQAEARAERLAEAGRRVTAAFRALGDSSCITAAAIKRRECEAAMTAFDALLRDQEEQ